MTGKEYVYRVYTAAGAYVGVWNDVISEPSWSQRLGMPGTSTSVRLGRSANRTIEQRTVLATEGLEDLLDQSDDPLVASYETNNTIGEDTDVELNYNVDVYAHYGDFENLLTEDGQQFMDQSDDPLVTAIGAPLGTRVFSGFVLDYDALYGDEDGVEVTLMSHGYELGHSEVLSGSDTTVTYTSQNHDVVVKNILDTNPGKMSYSAASIDASPSTMSQVFRLNTKLEAIEEAHAQSDDNFYWYGNVGENYIYFKARATTAEHTFVYRKHINKIKLKRSIEDLRNVVYFVGGDTGGGVILYKKYTDAGAIASWRKGVYRITDRRYTVAASAQRRANKVLARYKNPVYTTTVRIPAGAYDIETIRLGQMVAFANFDNFVDNLLLQIVEIDYTPNMVTLGLGELIDRQRDIVADVEEQLQGEQFETIPTAPS